jgi:uncharacterized membrane protein YesL
MKLLKRIIRLCALILFMLLAAAGISIFGVAPALSKDRKLFVDIETKSENCEKKNKDSSKNEKLNF